MYVKRRQTLQPWCAEMQRRVKSCNCDSKWRYWWSQTVVGKVRRKIQALTELTPEVETPERHSSTPKRKARLVSCEKAERNALPESFLGKVSAVLVQGPEGCLAAEPYSMSCAPRSLPSLSMPGQRRQIGYMWADSYFEQTPRGLFLWLLVTWCMLHRALMSCALRLCITK